MTQAWRIVWASGNCILIIYSGLCVGVDGKMGTEMCVFKENGNPHRPYPEMSSILRQRWTVGLGPMVVRQGLWDWHTWGHFPEGEAALPCIERFRMDIAKQLRGGLIRKGLGRWLYTGSHSVAIYRFLFHFIYSQNYSQTSPKLDKA